MFFIGKAFVQQFMGDLDHGRHMLGSLGIIRCRLYRQCLNILHKTINVPGGKILQRLFGSPCPFDGIVIQISEIHTGIHLEALILKIAGNEVRHHKTPAQRKVGRFISRRPTGVKGN